jgi:DNA-binding CsgD family transcriptional regulator
MPSLNDTLDSDTGCARYEAGFPHGRTQFCAKGPRLENIAFPRFEKPIVGEVAHLQARRRQLSGMVHVKNVQPEQPYAGAIYWNRTTRSADHQLAVSPMQLEDIVQSERKEFAHVKVVAACDRSYLARCIREQRWSRQELDVAEQAAEVVEWHATLGEERIGLLLMAELFAPLDSAKAAAFLARYRELGEIKSPLHHRRDARLAAFAQYSTAVTEIALGNSRRGLVELRSALSVFERFGYDWRAARCLLVEHSVTGNPELLPIAAEKMRHYGQSWLAVELRALGERPRDVMLWPQQQRVFEEVCRGKSTAEIAKSLGRSEHTINNQIKAVFKAFGVKSRSALLVEAARRGLLPS